MGEANDTADDTSAVSIEDAPERVERRSIVVDASPSAVFELLADPAQHATFDGSGTVRRAASDEQGRLSLGSKFGMKMKYGIPYRITNEVIEFDVNERIAWRHIGRHVWRYTLEPAGEGDGKPRTKIVEEFDWRPSRAPWALKLVNAPRDNAAAIERTLVRLRDRFS